MSKWDLLVSTKRDVAKHQPKSTLLGATMLKPFYVTRACWTPNQLPAISDLTVLIRFVRLFKSKTRSKSRKQKYYQKAIEYLSLTVALYLATAVWQTSPSLKLRRSNLKNFPCQCLLWRVKFLGSIYRTIFALVKWITGIIGKKFTSQIFC